jgi:hypothetical protein
MAKGQEKPKKNNKETDDPGEAEEEEGRSRQGK